MVEYCDKRTCAALRAISSLAAWCTLHLPTFPNSVSSPFIPPHPPTPTVHCMNWLAMCLLFYPCSAFIRPRAICHVNVREMGLAKGIPRGFTLTYNFSSCSRSKGWIFVWFYIFCSARVDCSSKDRWGGGVAVVIRGIGGSPVCPPRNYPLLFANVLLLHTTTTNCHPMCSLFTEILPTQEAIMQQSSHFCWPSWDVILFRDFFSPQSFRISMCGLEKAATLLLLLLLLLLCNPPPPPRTAATNDPMLTADLNQYLEEHFWWFYSSFHPFGQ